MTGVKIVDVRNNVIQSVVAKIDTSCSNLRLLNESTRKTYANNIKFKFLKTWSPLDINYSIVVANFDALTHDKIADEISALTHATTVISATTIIKVG